jgi:ADP-heptose:LPS heptosyltransferase
MRMPAEILTKAMSACCHSLPLQKDAIGSILVIRMNRIGDMICALPLIKTLRAEFPNARITVLAESGNAEIARHEPYIDRVIVYKRPSGLFGSRIVNIKRALYGEDFDLAIGVKGGFSGFLALAAFLSGARYRIGYIARGKRLLNRCFNLPVEPLDFGSMSQVDACLNLLKPIGGRKEIKDISLNIPQDIVNKAAAFLNSVGSGRKSGLVIFNISNNRAESSWSGDKIVKLARYFADRYQYKSIIAGLPGHEDMASTICGQIGTGAFYYRTETIMDFAAICSQCNVLVTGDGGASHVGAASGALVITLFGSASPTVWRPYGEGHISLKSEDGKANSIGVERVIEAIRENGILT